MSKELFKVADKFLEIAKEVENPVSVQKLMELVYLAHCHSLNLKDEPLFENSIEAHASGIMIPELYSCFPEHSGADVINEVTIGMSYSEDTPELDPEIVELVSNTLGMYSGQFEEHNLSEFVNRIGTPYYMTYKEGETAKISNDVIKDYYNNVMDAYVTVSMMNGMLVRNDDEYVEGDEFEGADPYIYNKDGFTYDGLNLSEEDNDVRQEYRFDEFGYDINGNRPLRGVGFK